MEGLLLRAVDTLCHSRLFEDFTREELMDWAARFRCAFSTYRKDQIVFE